LPMARRVDARLHNDLCTDCCAPLTVPVDEAYSVGLVLDASSRTTIKFQPSDLHFGKHP
jgi:hypothetical protein